MSICGINERQGSVIFWYLQHMDPFTLNSLPLPVKSFNKLQKQEMHLKSIWILNN